MPALIAEGGYQVFELKGGEWAVLLLSAVAALIAIAVGLFLAKLVMAEDEGSPKMQEIAKAIQEGAAAYLKRQFKTIAIILVPLAAIVFLTSTEIIKPGGETALTFVQSGAFRTLAFILGCLASGFTGYIGMTLATRGNVRTAAAALTNSLPRALTVAFRTGGVAGMFTVGLGLLGATAIIMGHARGVLLLAIRSAGLTLVELKPNAVKKSLTGHGHAGKGQMQRAVQSIFGLDRPPEPPDVADAVAIALCATRRLTAGDELGLAIIGASQRRKQSRRSLPPGVDIVSTS